MDMSRATTSNDGRIRRRLALAAVALGAFAGLAMPAVARAEAFVAPGLLEGATAYPKQTVHVIVVAAPERDSGWLKNEGMKDANGREFGKVRREFKHIDAVAVDLTGARLVELAREDGIYSITPDGAVEKESLFAPTTLWPLAVGADKLWPTLLDNGPRPPAIAVIDSGVSDRSLDFGGRITDKVNLSSFKTSDSGGDGLGHGTLVAGIAAGAAPGYPGVAPRANIVSVRVVNADGLSLVSDVLAAAEWVLENRVSKGIGVVNFSLRTTHPNYGLRDPINLAVERLWMSGTVVVASAGNNGAERMVYAPASDPFAITVGAADIRGTVDVDDDVNAPWSSYGHTAEGFAKPEVAAPGRYMAGPVPPESTLARLFPSRITAPGYMWMSGTSFAAPIVTGAAAQILARHPGWSPDEVKGALMLTARQLPGAVPLSMGVGEIDVPAAAALVSPPRANENLYEFVRTDAEGDAYFDAAAWNARVSADASWTSASWTSASWTSASWTSASWTSASWTSSAHVDASWTSASWTSASWTSASWTSASWTSASWTSASVPE